VIEPLFYGGTARNTSARRAKRLTSLPIPVPGPGDLKFAEACRQEAMQVFPQVGEMFEGFLEGGDWDEDAFSFYFFARKQGLLRGCTNFAVLPSATLDRETLVGRNYDWAYSDLPYCESRVIAVDDALKFVSYTHHWIGHPDCLNEAGLFIAISSLPAIETCEPGVQWNILVDAMASSCRTVSEAVALLSGVRHLRAITYLIADADDAAAVEASPKGVHVRTPKDCIVIATNHVVGESDGSDRSLHSTARYERADDRLSVKVPGIAESDITSVLKDPVCTIRDGKRFLHPLDHVPLAAAENWGTIWSTVCRPARGEIKVAEGHPEDAHYVPIKWSHSIEDQTN
jgi:hypothetical protein